MEEKILRELGLVQDDTRGQERGWTTVSLASKWPRIVVADEAQRALSAYVPMGKYGDFQEPVQPLSGDSGWEILLWNVGEAITRTSLQGHSTPVTALDITPDGRWGISGCWGRVIRVWDLDAARQRRALPGHEGIVNAVSITADGRRAASGSEDATLKVWDLETGDVVATFVGEGWITDCWIAPGGELFVAREGNEAQRIRYHVLRLCGPVS